MVYKVDITFARDTNQIIHRESVSYTLMVPPINDAAMECFRFQTTDARIITIPVRHIRLMEQWEERDN